jgi:phage tail tape-measure protein
VKRRNEGAGGAMSGAAKGAATGATVASVVPGIGTLAGGVVGGVAGAIGGAFTKNAKTAMTDLSVEDAQAVIRQAYQQALGRVPSDAEVMAQLQGIGFDPKRHQWVGEEGVIAILRSLNNGERHA